MDPVARDLFRAGPMLVRFTRAGGRVTAAVVSRGALTFARGASGSSPRKTGVAPPGRERLGPRRHAE